MLWFPQGDDQGEATRARVKSILETLAPLETNKVSRDLLESG